MQTQVHCLQKKNRMEVRVEEGVNFCFVNDIFIFCRYLDWRRRTPTQAHLHGCVSKQKVIEFVSSKNEDTRKNSP